MPVPFYVIAEAGRTLVDFVASHLVFNPIAKPVLREDDLHFDASHPKTGAHLASWKSATFGMVRNGGERAHQGWDFFAMPGTPCYAITGGTIIHYNEQPTGLGHLVGLSCTPKRLGVPIIAVYAHLSKILVKDGASVRAGEKIGLTGTSGNASPHKRYPHLHFEVRTSKDGPKGLGNRLDPTVLFGDVQAYRSAVQRCPYDPGLLARAAATS